MRLAKILASSARVGVSPISMVKIEGSMIAIISRSPSFFSQDSASALSFSFFSPGADTSLMLNTEAPKVFREEPA